MRGGERVLEALASAYPNADLFTLFYVPGSTSQTIESLRIVPSRFNRLPKIKQHYRKLLPLYPWALDQLKPSGYDLVLSISHAVAKNILTEARTPHLCYCLTPMRYIWDQTDAYLGRGLKRALATPLVHSLRRFDISRSSKAHVDRFAAISSAVSDRIQSHYKRPSDIVFPPVDIEGIRPDGRGPDDFYLLVGGFVPYKREDVAIEAFRHSRRRLVIAGDGPTQRRLKRSAPSNVVFTGRITDAELTQLLQRCRALIYPQEEDFGIVAVEVQAAGRPVIALGRGGALDTVRPLLSIVKGGERDSPQTSGATGIFFMDQTPDALRRALDSFERSESEFRTSSIREHAETFGKTRFLREIDQQIQKTLKSANQIR